MSGPERIEGADAGPGSPGLARVVEVLAAGGVVGLPTDTVYGLCADPTVPGAAGRIFALKQRPATTAMAVLVAGADQAATLTGAITGRVRRLVDAYWPGALTVVVDRRAGVALDLGGDPTSVGLRCPAHPVARAVAAAAGPYAATSANLHGAAPLVTAEALALALPEVDLVVDGGPCTGVASTVVDVRAGALRVLRPGDLSLPQLLGAWEAPL